MSRRALLAIALLGATLHLVGMMREPLPAQDGLKFLQVARRFGREPWVDVVRGSDQHPLYPACIAMAHPAVAAVLGDGPTSWRVAAQGVSALACLALLFPLHALTRAQFGARAADLAALFFVLLPLPAEIAHDTLSDGLALLTFTLAFGLGERALRTRRTAPAIGCGLAAGVGYLARPELAITPMAVVLAALPAARWRTAADRAVTRRFAAPALAALVVVGGYALVKGELSEKLSLRRSVGVASVHDAPKRADLALPEGLDDPRWDFSPKEEGDEPARKEIVEALSGVLYRWARGLGWALLPMAAWGAWHFRRDERSCTGRSLTLLYVGLFGLILTRHAAVMGYLSERHALTMVVATLPLAAAAVEWRGRRFAERMGWDGPRARRWSAAGLASIVFLGASVQLFKPGQGHPTRWGFAEAGRWIASHAEPGDAMLDTRGWAAFVSGLRSYDYWHVKQALSDARLAFVVVGEDELTAASGRGETLRAWLAFAAEPVAAFPDREGGAGVGVRVFRFHRPESWEGLRP